MRDDVRDILERGVQGFDPGDGFGRTMRRVRRRHTSRRVVAGVTALSIAAAGGLFAWSAFRTGERRTPRPAAAVTFANRIALPGTPSDIAISENGIWVTTLGGKVLRIDPKTKEVTEVASTEGFSYVAVGFGSLWVLDVKPGRVHRISLNDLETIDRIDLPVESLGSRPDLITITPDEVRLASRGGLGFTIDPTTHVVGRRTATLPGPRTFYQQAGDVLWEAGPSWLEGNSPRASLRAHTGLSLTAFAASPDALWFVDLRRDIQRFVLSEGIEKSPSIRPGDPIATLAAEPDIVWVVTTPEAGEATRLSAYSADTGDPLGSADSVGAPGRFNTDWATHIAVGQEDVWVTDPRNNALLRFDTSGNVDQTPPSIGPSPPGRFEVGDCLVPAFRPQRMPWPDSSEPRVAGPRLIWRGPPGKFSEWRVTLETTLHFSTEHSSGIEGITDLVPPFDVRGNDPAVRRLGEVPAGRYVVLWEERETDCGSYMLTLTAPGIGDERAIEEIATVTESIPEG